MLWGRYQTSYIESSRKRKSCQKSALLHDFSQNPLITCWLLAPFACLTLPQTHSSVKHEHFSTNFVPLNHCVMTQHEHATYSFLFLLIPGHLKLSLVSNTAKRLTFGRSESWRLVRKLHFLPQSTTQASSFFRNDWRPTALLEPSTTSSALLDRSKWTARSEVVGEALGTAQRLLELLLGGWSGQESVSARAAGTSVHEWKCGTEKLNAADTSRAAHSQPRQISAQRLQKFTWCP